MTNADRYALDNCIKCSICVSHCPVAAITDKFAGPKQNGPDLERFRLEGAAVAHPSVGYCSNCKNCDVACPSGVNISAMNCLAKGEFVGRGGASLRDRLLARAELMGKVCRLAPAVVNWSGKNKILRRLGQKFLGVSAEMTLPRYAGRTFYELYKINNNIKKQDSGKQKVVYYPGCYVNYNTPEVGLAVIDVMARNGIRVVVDKFNCCSLPLVSNGLLKEAGSYAQRNINQLQNYLDLGYSVITSCPSCNLTLRREYQELFGFYTTHLNEKVYDVFEYLQILLQQGELDINFKPLPLRTGYHQPCHLKAGGCGVPSLEILRLIPGLQVYDLDAGCCGLSGSYGFKSEKYPISMEIGRELFHTVNASGVKQVITECGMCGLQINHGTGVAVYHPIQLLAEAYGSGAGANPMPKTPYRHGRYL